MAARKIARMTLGNNTPIGSLIQSRLTEPQFQLENGSAWVLMDGRDVTGSRYAAITGQTVLDDARGRFIRSKDNGAGVAPTEEALGAEQADAFQNITGTLSGNASSVGGYFQTGTGAINLTLSSANRLTDGIAAAGRFRGFNFDASNSPGARTSSETRPLNITMNTFIKINP